MMLTCHILFVHGFWLLLLLLRAFTLLCCIITKSVIPHTKVRPLHTCVKLDDACWCLAIDAPYEFHVFCLLQNALRILNGSHLFGSDTPGTSGPCIKFQVHHKMAIDVDTVEMCNDGCICCYSDINLLGDDMIGV